MFTNSKSHSNQNSQAASAHCSNCSTVVTHLYRIADLLGIVNNNANDVESPGELTTRILSTIEHHLLQNLEEAKREQSVLSLALECYATQIAPLVEFAAPLILGSRNKNSNNNNDSATSSIAASHPYPPTPANVIQWAQRAVVAPSQSRDRFEQQNDDGYESPGRRNWPGGPPPSVEDLHHQFKKYLKKNHPPRASSSSNSHQQQENTTLSILDSAGITSQLRSLNALCGGFEYSNNNNNNNASSLQSELDFYIQNTKAAVHSLTLQNEKMREDFQHLHSTLTAEIDSIRDVIEIFSQQRRDAISVPPTSDTSSFGLLMKKKIMSLSSARRRQNNNNSNKSNLNAKQQTEQEMEQEEQNVINGMSPTETLEAAKAIIFDASMLIVKNNQTSSERANNMNNGSNKNGANSAAKNFDAEFAEKQRNQALIASLRSEKEELLNKLSLLHHEAAALIDQTTNTNLHGKSNNNNNNNSKLNQQDEEGNKTTMTAKEKLAQISRAFGVAADAVVQRKRLARSLDAAKSLAEERDVALAASMEAWTEQINTICKKLVTCCCSSACSHHNHSTNTSAVTLNTNDQNTSATLLNTSSITNTNTNSNNNTTSTFSELLSRLDSICHQSLNSYRSQRLRVDNLMDDQKARGKRLKQLSDHIVAACSELKVPLIPSLSSLNSIACSSSSSISSLVMGGGKSNNVVMPSKQQQQQQQTRSEKELIEMVISIKNHFSGTNANNSYRERSTSSSNANRNHHQQNNHNNNNNNAASSLHEEQVTQQLQLQLQQSKATIDKLKSDVENLLERNEELKSHQDELVDQVRRIQQSNANNNSNKVHFIEEKEQNIDKHQNQDSNITTTSSSNNNSNNKELQRQHGLLCESMRSIILQLDPENDLLEDEMLDEGAQSALAKFKETLSALIDSLKQSYFEVARFKHQNSNDSTAEEMPAAVPFEILDSFVSDSVETSLRLSDEITSLLQQQTSGYQKPSNTNNNNEFENENLSSPPPAAAFARFYSGCSKTNNSNRRHASPPFNGASATTTTTSSSRQKMIQIGALLKEIFNHLASVSQIKYLNCGNDDMMDALEIVENEMIACNHAAHGARQQQQQQQKKEQRSNEDAINNNNNGDTSIVFKEEGESPQKSSSDQEEVLPVNVQEDESFLENKSIFAFLMASSLAANNEASPSPFSAAFSPSPPHTRDNASPPSSTVVVNAAKMKRYHRKFTELLDDVERAAGVVSRLGKCFSKGLKMGAILVQKDIDATQTVVARMLQNALRVDVDALGCSRSQAAALKALFDPANRHEQRGRYFISLPQDDDSNNSNNGHQQQQQHPLVVATRIADKVFEQVTSSCFDWKRRSEEGDQLLDAVAFHVCSLAEQLQPIAAASVASSASEQPIHWLVAKTNSANPEHEEEYVYTEERISNELPQVIEKLANDVLRAVEREQSQQRPLAEENHDECKLRAERLQADLSAERRRSSDTACSSKKRVHELENMLYEEQSRVREAELERDTAESAAAVARAQLAVMKRNNNNNNNTIANVTSTTTHFEEDDDDDEDDYALVDSDHGVNTDEDDDDDDVDRNVDKNSDLYQRAYAELRQYAGSVNKQQQQQQPSHHQQGDYYSSDECENNSPEHARSRNIHTSNGNKTIPQNKASSRALGDTAVNRGGGLINSSSKNNSNNNVRKPSPTSSSVNTSITSTSSSNVAPSNINNSRNNQNHNNSSASSYAMRQQQRLSSSVVNKSKPPAKVIRQIAVTTPFTS